jgi:hypothetical protein
MKTIVFALALCGTAFAGKGTGLPPEQEVTVYVFVDAPVDYQLIYLATHQASAMFAKIGVRIEWKAAGKPDQPTGCPKSIALTIQETAPKNARPNDQGKTRLPDGSITIFYERLRPIIRYRPDLSAAFLAHVLAHEIGHSLQGVNRHSETGIMKAYWKYADYGEMQRGRMGFTPLDIGLIRAGPERSCQRTE